jgi:ParB/RepB/Spo0J family partition protein
MDVKSIPISSIIVTENTRDPARLGDLSELMSSIKKEGLLQSIGVAPKKVGDKTKNQIIYGHRRFVACKKLGLKSIEAKVYTKLKEADKLVLTITENEQREDVSVFETGRVIWKLLNEEKLTKREVSKRLDKSLAWVEDYLHAYHVTPDEFRGQVVYNPGTDKDRKTIGLTVAATIGRLSKDNVVAKKDIKELFKLAVANALSVKDIKSITPNLRGGMTVKQALDKHKKTTVLSVRLPLPHRKYAALVKELGSRAKVEAYFRQVMKEDLAAR